MALGRNKYLLYGNFFGDVQVYQGCHIAVMVYKNQLSNINTFVYGDVKSDGL